jgi:hypothetical protein
MDILAKKYNQKKYYENFKIKNLDKLTKINICPLCKNSYTYFTKSKHLKSKKHNNFLNKLSTSPVNIDLDTPKSIDNDIKINYII